MHIVVALGGNALLRRGEALSAAAQQASIRGAARLLADAILDGHHLTITHGNGPQFGLLALQSLAGPAASILPLDVLGAESEGWIGYTIELALRNALTENTSVVSLLTQTLVDREDKAFSVPTQPIGPVYDEATARHLAAERKWSVVPDGNGWRRIVASPKPRGIIEIASIRRMIKAGIIVICAGGGGIPVCRGTDGEFVGVEAVIDKDATSALLAQEINADLLVMLTDVDGVYLDYGTDHARKVNHADPDILQANGAEFKAGSMAPKVAAACAFVRGTGNRAAVGALSDLSGMIAGAKGTMITPKQAK